MALGVVVHAVMMVSASSPFRLRSTPLKWPQFPFELWGHGRLASCSKLGETVLEQLGHCGHLYGRQPQLPECGTLKH